MATITLASRSACGRFCASAWSGAVPAIPRKARILTCKASAYVFGANRQPRGAREVRKGSTRSTFGLFLSGADAKIELPPLQIHAHHRNFHLVAQTIAA